MNAAQNIILDIRKDYIAVILEESHDIVAVIYPDGRAGFVEIESMFDNGESFIMDIPLVYQRIEEAFDLYKFSFLERLKFQRELCRFALKELNKNHSME